LSNGRGILVLTGHFGNFELLSLSHSLHGNRIAIVQRPNRNPIIDRAVAARRLRNGNLTVSRKGAGREILRLLRQNWMVAVPLDLDVRRGVFVDFFSKPACTTTGLARVALHTDAAVVPGYCWWDPQLRKYRLRFEPPVELIRTGDTGRDIFENTQKFAKVIEEIIRKHPDQWVWIHARWKTRPEGEPKLYEFLS